MKKVIPFLGILMIIGIILAFFYLTPKEILNIKGTITEISNDNLTIVSQDGKTFKITNFKEDYVMGSTIELLCEDNNEIIDLNNCEIKNYTPKKIETEEKKELFQDYYEKSEEIVNNLSIEEKISQLLIVRHAKQNDINIQKENQFGGIIFYESDFKNKTKEEVKKMINDLQNVSNIPLLTAIDEEGGKVSRLSSNKNLVTTPFKSSQELYKEGGLAKIREDVQNKSAILKDLGLNLNLAPVVDVSTNQNDYMFARSLGLDTDTTSQYAEAVITASKNTGVSYTLKHFPGYGNNLDTHIGSSIDNKKYEDILKEDIPPFASGINAGAEAVMVSHNIVVAIENTPASLSINVHNILRNDLNFSGVIITDDLSMGALNSYEDIYIKALLADNDLIITSSYNDALENIQKGLKNNIINEELINKKVTKIIAWKLFKNLF